MDVLASRIKTARKIWWTFNKTLSRFTCHHFAIITFVGTQNTKCCFMCSCDTFRRLSITVFLYIFIYDILTKNGLVVWRKLISTNNHINKYYNFHIHMYHCIRTVPYFRLDVLRISHPRQQEIQSPTERRCTLSKFFCSQPYEDLLWKFISKVSYSL